MPTATAKQFEVVVHVGDRGEITLECGECGATVAIKPPGEDRFRVDWWRKEKRNCATCLAWGLLVRDRPVKDAQAFREGARLPVRDAWRWVQIF